MESPKPVAERLFSRVFLFRANANLSWRHGAGVALSTPAIGLCQGRRIAEKALLRHWVIRTVRFN